MIWKDYLKLSEIASYSKLARASKAPPPPSPGGIGLTQNLNVPGEGLQQQKVLFLAVYLLSRCCAVIS